MTDAERMRLECYWHGWRHWLFGVEWFERNRAAWVFRWIVSLGPFDVRWRL